MSETIELPADIGEALKRALELFELTWRLRAISDGAGGTAIAVAFQQWPKDAHELADALRAAKLAIVPILPELTQARTEVFSFGVTSRPTAFAMLLYQAEATDHVLTSIRTKRTVNEVGVAILEWPPLTIDDFDKTHWAMASFPKVALEGWNQLKATIEFEAWQAARRRREKELPSREGVNEPHSAITPTEPTANGKPGATVGRRPWTQDAVNNQLAAMKDGHYFDLVRKIGDGDQVAKKGARDAYGRNKLAVKIGCSPAQITKSPVWIEMALALQLPRGSHGKVARPVRIGHDIAVESASKAAGDTTESDIIRRETIGMIRASTDAEEAGALIFKLESGEITDDVAREIVDTIASRLEDRKSDFP